MRKTQRMATSRVVRPPKNIPELEQFVKSNDPTKYSENIRTLLEYCSPHERQVIISLVNRVQAGKVSANDVKLISFIAKGAAFWDIIGRKPKEISQDQGKIVLDADRLIARLPFNSYRELPASYNSNYVLISSMGYLFDFQKNDFRTGVYEEFTQKMKTRARSNTRIKDKVGFVKAMQSNLLGLLSIYRGINRRIVRNPAVRKKRQITEQ